MTDKEGGHFCSSEGNMPTKETLPDGSYKYIFFGQDGAIIISSLSIKKEHADLISRPFDGDTDDAGRLVLTWAKSPDEIAREIAHAVVSFQNLMVSQQRQFDDGAYRKQLETNLSPLSFTSIKIEPDYGSNSLHYYKPNPNTRLQFMGRLGELFPNAHIIEGK